MMRGARELQGIAVVDVAGGEKLGVVADVIVSPDDGRLLAFVMREGSILSRKEWVIEVDDVRSIGRDAVTVEGADLAHIPEAAAEAIQEARGSDRQLIGRKAVTQGGTALGTINDFMLDEGSRRLAAVVIGGGMLEKSDAIPADRILSVGPDMVVIRDPGEAEGGAPSPFV